MKQWYNFYWKDGTVDSAKGYDFCDAFRSAGYGAGALSALDYYEEAKELPFDYKEVVFIKKNEPELLGQANSRSQFIQQLVQQVKMGVKKPVVSVVGNEWVLSVKITPFQIECRCLEHRLLGELQYSA